MRPFTLKYIMNTLTTLNQSLKFSDNRQVDGAYIITIKGHPESEKLALRCSKSCSDAGMKSVLWEAFNGTGDEIIVPEHIKNQQFLYWLKKPNNKYSNSQIGVFLSHYSLWAHCAAIDKPIVILEHDAIMVKALEQHNFYNSIQFLGCKEQLVSGRIPIGIPPHGSIYNGHWRFICRAHAYAIDPPVARNLLSYAIREGITKTLDVFMRCDIFSIVQDGFYAYDERGISTIDELENYTEDC
jgi:hypothetical protein